MGLSAASARLADLPDPVHNFRRLLWRIAKRGRSMKRPPLPRILLIVFFLGLLATPYVVRRVAAHRQGDRSRLDAQSALSRHGFYFQEVSHAAGVDFIHQAPTLDAKL